MADALNKWNHADFGAIASKIPHFFPTLHQMEEADAACGCSRGINQLESVEVSCTWF
jgi:hypothetical protein